MPEHTPEPWHLDGLKRRLYGPTPQRAPIGEIYPGSAYVADADRIVACVNGCQGINPEAVPDVRVASQAAYEFLYAMSLSPLARAAKFGPDYDRLSDQLFLDIMTGLQAALAKAKVT